MGYRAEATARHRTYREAAAMPTTFPVLNEDTGEFEEVTYYDTHEVAALLHVSYSAARAAMVEGRWPHLVLMRTRYMSRRDIARALELSRRDPDAIPEGRDVAHLGVPLSDRDLEGMA